MYLLFIICAMGITGPTSECENVAYKHFTSKTPRGCPVCSPMQSRHKQSRAEDAEQNQTFYFI